MTPEHLIEHIVEVQGHRCKIRDLDGVEGIFRPFRLVVELAQPPDFPFDPHQLLKEDASLLLERDGAELRRIDGIITEASLTATEEGVADMRLVLEPRLALAAQRLDSRIFRDLSVIDIVTQVLADIKVVPQLRLSQSYPQRAYCVQYQERDLDFVHRLLEDEGIFYFFGEGDTLVLGDSPAAFEAIAGEPAIPYRPPSQLEPGQEAIVSLTGRAELTAGRVTLRDFNPEHPSLDMDVSALVPDAVGELCPEYYEFPGEYLEPEEGAPKAQRWAEAKACHGADTQGISHCPRLVPGFTFALLQPPPGIAEGEYVVTSLTHRWHWEQDVFANTFVLRPADSPYRPAHATAEPLAPSLVTGFVTGPAGADIHTDEIGRVKVHFHWDRRQPFDDDCSDWIPVLQDNTGSSSAMPRIGWEVAVSYLEGDPDRPVVLGRVYNGADPFPEVLPEGKTRSALRSLSSPSRQGVNMIRFDDAAGREQVLMHSERNQRIVIGNNRSEEVLSHETATVVGDEHISVGSFQTVKISQDWMSSVKGSQTHTVAANRTKDITGAESVSVGADHSLAVGSSHKRKVGGSDSLSAQGLTEMVGGMLLHSALGQKGIGAGAAMGVVVGGAMIEAAGLGKSEGWKKNRNETVGGLAVSLARKTIDEQTKIRTTNVAGLLEVTAATSLKLDAVSSLSANAPAIKISGGDGLSVQVGDSSVALSGEGITIKASTIIVECSGEASYSA